MFKEQSDIQQFALEVENVDVEGLVAELMAWRREVSGGSYDDDIRYAMIDTFIDMVVDHCH